MPFFFNRNLWFAGLVLAVLIAFFCSRPLNSPSYRLIAADGLGYYSYLPARFIYNDLELKFQWFDTVFNRHYTNNLFAKPSDNFMVSFGSRAINKYYPGQSLLQLPFFLIAHAAAKIFNYAADGFSLPYQLGMGLAALFYSLLGLFFCSKLIWLVFNNRLVSILAPLLVFFGSNLFTYTIYSGCYSHAYSFCMISLAFYSAYRFFNKDTPTSTWFFMTLFFSVMVLCIRPFNVILLAGLFYFYKPFSWKAGFGKGGNRTLTGLFILLTVMAAAYSLDSIYRQTHGFLINSYAGERFYFNHPAHIADNFLGFQYGLLWYAPIVLLSLSALFFTGREPKLLFLLLPVLAIIVLYSFWWYWNIVSRAIVDCSALLAFLLAYVLVRLNNRRTYKAVLAGAVICVPFFQLKAYQLRQGILDSNYTYSKYYAKHFFTLRPVSVFPVNPATVLEKQDYFHDFESESGAEVSVAEAFEGRQSAVLNDQVEYACTHHYTVPGFFNRAGFKKVKASFWIRASGQINNIHLVLTFTRKDSSLAYRPFYLNGARLRKDKWDFKEFGMDLPAAVQPGDRLSIYFWNPDHKNEAYIDNLKTEFFLTDGSDEVTLK